MVAASAENQVEILTTKPFVDSFNFSIFLSEQIEHITTMYEYVATEMREFLMLIMRIANYRDSHLAIIQVQLCMANCIGVKLCQGSFPAVQATSTRVLVLARFADVQIHGNRVSGAGEPRP